MTPCGRATARTTDPTRTYLDNISVDEVHTLREAQEKVESRVVTLIKGDGDTGPPTAMPVFSLSDSYPEVAAFMTQSSKDVQKAIQKFLKESRGGLSQTGYELHKCFVERFPNTSLSALCDILPSFSMKEVSLSKEQGSAGPLPKLEYRCTLFGECLGFSGLNVFLALRWLTIPPGLSHCCATYIPSEEERDSTVRCCNLLHSSLSVCLLCLEMRDLPDWSPGKSFPNLHNALTALKLVLKRSLIIAASGEYWFGTKSPHQPLTGGSGWYVENPHPLRLDRGINIVTALTETDLGIPTFRCSLLYVRVECRALTWTELTFSGSALWTIKGVTLPLNIRGDVRFQHLPAVVLGGCCDNGTLPGEVFGIQSAQLQDIEVIFTCVPTADGNGLSCKECVVSGVMSLCGENAMQAQVVLTNPSRPRILCESRSISLGVFAHFLSEYCKWTVTLPQWVHTLNLCMVDAEVHFGNNKQITIVGWVRVLDVEGRGSAQLSPHGLHISAKLPELRLGSLMCKPLASTDNAVGFELHVADDGAQADVFATAEINALLTCPVVFHLSEKGCTAEVEHIPPGYPWMGIKLTLVSDVTLSQEFVVSGVLNRRMAEDALHRALLDVPVVAEVVSVGLDFAFKLNHVTLLPLTLSRPTLCIRFVGIFLGSDFNVIAVMDIDNVATYLAVVASIIVENCSSVVRNIWNEFVRVRHEPMSASSSLEHAADLTFAASMTHLEVTESSAPTATNFVNDAFETYL